jgi:ADP-heptose:LPS heptosyltransferase
MGALRTGRALPDLSSYEARSIVIVRLKALGDIVLSLPIIYALRSRYPDARMRYLCRRRYAECLSGIGELDETLILPPTAAQQMSLALRLRRERVDCVIDLLGSPRSAYLAFITGAAMRIGMDTGRRNWCYTHLLPRVLVRNGERVRCYTLESNRELIEMLGLEPDRSMGLKIGFPAAEPEKGWAREYVSGLGIGGGKIIGIVPGWTYRAKSWPERHFIELARRCRERFGGLCVILWGPGEEGLARRIVAGAEGSVLAPPMGIARLGALVSVLDLLVGIDSGPKHLAVIQGVPTVTLFGPTDPRIWDPMTPLHRAIRLEGDSNLSFKRKSTENSDLSKLTPDVVLNEIARVFSIVSDADGGTRKGGCA